MEDLISVIVPVYNVRNWLPETLGSIAAQSYGNFEVIMVDDGSTDGSGDICDRKSAEDPRFRVIHQENGGVSAARNAALSAARGKYVFFADSDDLMHSRALELLHAAICSGPYRMATANFITVDRHCDWETEIRPEDIHPTVMNGEDRVWDSVDQTKWEWLVVWDKLIERSLLADKSFDNVALEDVLLMFRIYKDIGQFVHLDIPLYAYLNRSGSLTTDAVYMGMKSEVTAKEYMLRYADGNALYRGWILKKTARRYLTSRYHVKGREGRKALREAFGPFAREHGKEYLSSRTIPFTEKMMFLALFLCPWAVWIYMKMTDN